MDNFDLETTFIQQTTRPSRWIVSGSNAGEFVVKYRFIKGYDILSVDGRLLASTYKNTNNAYVRCIKLSRNIAKGIGGVFESEDSSLTLKEKASNQLLLSVDDVVVGVINYNDYPYSITLTHNGMPFSVQFVIMFYLWDFLEPRNDAG